MKIFSVILHSHLKNELMKEMNGERKRRLPSWLKMERASGDTYPRLKNLVEKNGLHTICTSGNCPNIGECWNAGTATFMILGDICTRSCKFCSVKTGKPLPVDRNEPRRLTNSIKIMGINHCVITSVDRDDLEDGGAAFWAEVIHAIKKVNPGTTIEALIPDFRGKEKDIQQVINAGPEVISHNVETVRRLTPKIRSRSDYDRSLGVLQYISGQGKTAKSGIMLGLGETWNEILKTMDDLINVSCKILTIGQYLQPTLINYPVKEYLSPEKFEVLRNIGLEKGFRFVESSPLVRSSYHAERHVEVDSSSRW